ncbi:MAG TPA: hypothetical protein VD948_01480 [Rhodothermales bacterium]|nr:hypothetical protein [Rhodothermales bacterium]
MLFVLLVGCAYSRREETPAPPRHDTRRRVPIDTDAMGAGTIHPLRVSEVVPGIRTLDVTPARVELRVGERLSMDSLRVVAYDSSGTRLGRLLVFDLSFRPGAFRVMGARTIEGVAEGYGFIELRTPLWARLGLLGAPPSTRVTVIVRD